jgi:hypothetical protein
MGLVRKVRKFVSGRMGREYAIRFRLLRSSLSPRSILARRRADVLIVSYPKCGRTWMTMLLSRALALHAGIEGVDYLATDLPGGRSDGLPRIRISHDDNPHWKEPGRLRRSKRSYGRKKVILLVRDPRDVVVSMYFERSRRERAYSGTLHEFLQEPRGSLDTILAYYNIWAAERNRPRALCLVRYEDLRADTAAHLRRILRFAGLENVSEDHVAEAVRFASFESMREMETSGAVKSGRLRPRDPSDVESFKTRRGKVGGYTDYLGPQEIEWMESRIRSTLDPFFEYAEPAGRDAAPVAAGRAAAGGVSP